MILSLFLFFNFARNRNQFKIRFLIIAWRLPVLFCLKYKCGRDDDHFLIWVQFKWVAFVIPIFGSSVSPSQHSFIILLVRDHSMIRELNLLEV